MVVGLARGQRRLGVLCRPGHLAHGHLEGICEKRAAHCMMSATKTVGMDLAMMRKPLGPIFRQNFGMRHSLGSFEGLSSVSAPSWTGLPTRFNDAMAGWAQESDLALKTGEDGRLVRDLARAEPKHVRHAIGLLITCPALLGCVQSCRAFDRHDRERQANEDDPHDRVRKGAESHRR